MKNLFTWQKGSKDLFHINKGLLQVLKLIWGGTTSSKVKAYYVLLISLINLQKHNGLRYTCLYMKACSVYVMKFIAQDPNKLDLTAFDIWVSLTDSGIPRIIPSYLRSQLRAKNRKVCKALLTVFNLYRVLDFKGILNLSTITDPSVYSTPSDFTSYIAQMKDLGIFPKISPIGLFAPYLIKSSGPCSSQGMNNTEGWITAMRGLKSVLTDLQFLTLLDIDKKRDWTQTKLFKFWSELTPLSNIVLGKLSAKEEPGKVRIFAMVDAITQWLLKPLHLGIFKFLRDVFLYDGTFDQIGELEKFLNKYKNEYFYSFDLSAATDRLPLSIQQSILSILLENKDYGYVWGHLLVGRDYHLTYKRISYKVRYNVGQPMGALSSWAMLALTHHLIVQYCAFLAYRKFSLFTKYIVLGDDIVIADKAVASVYHYIMTTTFSVKINLAKGLMSPHSLEFAKRFYVKGEDWSPLSLKEFSAFQSTWSSFTGAVARLSLTPSQILSVMGKGNIAKGSSSSVMYYLAKFLSFSLSLYNPKDPTIFIKTLFPNSDSEDLRDFLIKSIIRSKKCKMMDTLEKEGPSDYYRIKDKFLKHPSISNASNLVYSSFGNTPLETEVSKGITMESKSLLNRLLITIDSTTEPLYYLLQLPTPKLMEIYFLDLQALSADGQSPLLKAKPSKSFLKNWESVFNSLALIKDMVSHGNAFSIEKVSPEYKEIVHRIVTLK